MGDTNATPIPWTLASMRRSSRWTLTIAKPNHTQINQFCETLLKYFVWHSLSNKCQLPWLPLPQKGLFQNKIIFWWTLAWLCIFSRFGSFHWATRTHNLLKMITCNTGDHSFTSSTGQEFYLWRGTCRGPDHILVKHHTRLTAKATQRCGTWHSIFCNSPHWWKIHLKHTCLKVLLQPKFQDTYFCCLRHPELQFMLRDATGWCNNCNGLELQEGHVNVRLGSNFLFLGVQVTATFHLVWQISLLLTALHGPIHDHLKPWYPWIHIWIYESYEFIYERIMGYMNFIWIHTWNDHMNS